MFVCLFTVSPYGEKKNVTSKSITLSRCSWTLFKNLRFHFKQFDEWTNLKPWTNTEVFLNWSLFIDYYSIFGTVNSQLCKHSVLQNKYDAELNQTKSLSELKVVLNYILKNKLIFQSAHSGRNLSSSKILFECAGACVAH